MVRENNNNNNNNLICIAPVCAKKTSVAATKAKKEKSGKSQGKCVLAYGQLLQVLILTQNVQKRNYLLGTVVRHMKCERRKGFSYMQIVTWMLQDLGTVEQLTT